MASNDAVYTVHLNVDAKSESRENIDGREQDKIIGEDPEGQVVVTAGEYCLETCSRIYYCRIIHYNSVRVMQ